MSRFENLLEELAVPMDVQLFELALTHRSWAYEHGGVPHNERLEFLGDAVLGVTVTDHLYRAYPDFSEGRLAKMRAHIVSAHSLAEVARGLEIGPLLKLGQGEINTHGADKTSILADAMEALFGAAWLTDNDHARRLVLHLFVPLVEEAALMGPSLDWKTSLQEICAELAAGVPTYLVEQSGPEHDRRFTAHVIVGDDGILGEGRSTTKRGAEMVAAAVAFKALHARRAQHGAEDEPDPERA